MSTSTVYYVTAVSQGDKNLRVDAAKFPVASDANDHLVKLREAGHQSLRIEPRTETPPKEWETKGSP